jgi:hypothetical protein
MAFKPGESGNVKGRPKGTPNKVTAEVQSLCAKLLSDKSYTAKLAERLRRGKLAPAVEVLLWHYAYGKPKESFEHTTPDGRPLETVTRVVFGGRHKKRDGSDPRD